MTLYPGPESLAAEAGGRSGVPGLSLGSGWLPAGVGEPGWVAASLLRPRGCGSLGRLCWNPAHGQITRDAVHTPA